METGITKRYKTPPNKGSFYKVVSFILLPLGFWASYVTAKIFLDNKSKYIDQIFWVIFGEVLCIYMIIHSIYFLVIHTKGVFHAEITDVKIIGYSLNNKKIEISYDEIIKIQKNKISSYIERGFKSLHLVLKNRKKVLLWGGMNRFGDLIEEITKRSPNLISVDYGGLDKIPEIWNSQEYDDDGKPIKNKKVIQRNIKKGSKND